MTRTTILRVLRSLRARGRRRRLHQSRPRLSQCRSSAENSSSSTLSCVPGRRPPSPPLFSAPSAIAFTAETPGYQENAANSLKMCSSAFPRRLRVPAVIPRSPLSGRFLPIPLFSAEAFRGLSQAHEHRRRSMPGSAASSRPLFCLRREAAPCSFVSKS